MLSTILTLLMSGCIEVDIEIGIDANFTSYLTYRISLDVRDFDEQYHDLMRNSMNRLGWHYQEYFDFNVELHLDTDPCLLIMTRRINNTSFEQAYASLKDLLTDDNITPFMQVDMVYQSFERQNKYLINAETDIPQIISLSNADDLPPALLEHFDEAILSGQGSITLSLPASEIISSAQQTEIRNNQAVLTVPLSFTDTTAFELTAAVNFLRDGTPGGTSEEIINEQNRLKEIALYTTFAAAGLLILTLLIAVLTRKKKQKYVGRRIK